MFRIVLVILVVALLIPTFFMAESLLVRTPLCSRFDRPCLIWPAIYIDRGDHSTISRYAVKFRFFPYWEDCPPDATSVFCPLPAMVKGRLLVDFQFYY
ncbi:MAG: hypothetical protein V1685_02435 [Parcubacteria group bacterium]